MTGPSPITERVAEMRAAMAAQGPGPAGESFATGPGRSGLNTDGNRNLPVPATVILDRNRTGRWISVHPDYRIRTEPRQVIAALDHLAEEKK